MKIKKRLVARPAVITVAEQIEAELEDYSGSAVVLAVKRNVEGLTIVYRRGRNAWWTNGFNTPGETGLLSRLLADVDRAVLLTREDIIQILSDEAWL